MKQNQDRSAKRIPFPYLSHICIKNLFYRPARFILTRDAQKIPVWRTILTKGAPLLGANPSTVSKTRRILYAGALLEEPFIALYAILPFILRKELSASAFEISLLSTLKPAVALFSFYWSARLPQRPELLRTNLIGAGFFALLPFLFTPWISSPWYFLLASALYMFFSRAGIPAQMEILKRNLAKQERESIFSKRVALGCSLGAGLGLFTGLYLDSSTHAWKTLLFLSALLGLASVFYQSRLPIEGALPQIRKEKETKLLFLPWKESLSLLREKKEFAYWQLGYLFCGAGLMLSATPQALYLSDTLGIGHHELIMARWIFFALGFVLSTTLWARLLSRLSIQMVTSVICMGFALFFISLLLAQLSLIWLYIAFLLYGVCQGGSKVVWNLSGPYFAGKEESSRYSAVNVLMVGVRGVIFPFLGGYLCWATSPHFPFILGIAGCLIGSYFMLRKPKSARAAI